MTSCTGLKVSLTVIRIAIRFAPLNVVVEAEKTGNCAELKNLAFLGGFYDTCVGCL